MEESLFDIPETKSPRLLWMEKHGIQTQQNSAGDWCAWTTAILTKTSINLGSGDTEDEAITQLALKLGIKLWNEEGGSL